MHANPRTRAALLGLFLSGAAGLIDEVGWIRRSSLVFGSTTHALSTVLAVFFLGLALGSWTFGRLAQRSSHPLRMAARLEIGLAALVIATLPAFGAVERLYGHLHRALPPDSAALWAARAALVGAILLPPTFLMGGTLPLLGRQLVRDQGRIGASIARLYALNTAGAAIGALLAGFVLLPAIGTGAMLVLAAGLNVGAAALFSSAGATAPLPNSEAAPRATQAPAFGRHLVHALVFVTGFVALGEEVLWTRFLALIVRSSVLTYTITLALVLVGIVVGSLLVARLADRAGPRAWAFGALQVAGGLLVWLLLLLPPAWWRGLGGELPAAAMLLLPPAILAGASFPLAVRMVVTTPEWAGIGVGSMLAVNTLGGIAGALVTGFVLLPSFGLEAGVRVCTALALAAGVAAWLGLERGGVRRGRLTAAAAAALAWLAIPSLTGTRLPADFLAERERLVDWREGVEANLAVVRRPSGALVLEMDRWWQGQDRKTHQVMAAHLPMLLHPNPRRVLLVGVGAGQTPARLAMYDVERIDCVDIEPRVFDLVRAHFASGWMDDPRVRLLRMDGRQHLTHGAERYDVVSIEVGQLFRPGATSFYTLDFYRRAKARLAPGGLVSQFLPLPFLAPDELRAVVATFLEAFPGATLWYNTSELLLIGSAGAPPALEPGRVARVLADSTIARDLEFSLWGGRDLWLSRPEALHASFLSGPRGLAALARGGAIERDDRPRLEYAAARVRTDETREIETLPLLRRSLDPIAQSGPLPPVAARRAEEIRARNLDDVLAGARLRQAEGARDAGDTEEVARRLREALAANPDNLVANRWMGDALVLLGRAGEAEPFYRKAIAISDDDAASHAGLGMVGLSGRRFAEAAGHFRAALSLGPDDPEWRNSLGAALAQSGDLPGALVEFERAVALRPDYAQARDNVTKVRAAMARRAP